MKNLVSNLLFLVIIVVCITNKLKSQNQKKMFPLYYNTEKGENTAQVALSTYYLQPMSFDNQVMAMVGLDIFNRDYLLSAQLSDSYQYTLQIPTAFGDPLDQNPLKIYFNGWIGKKEVNAEMIIRNEVEQFVKKVISTYQNGTDNEWLNLWTSNERIEWSNLISNPEWRYFYENERDKFNESSTFIVFEINFGPNALVYYQNVNCSCSGLGALTFFLDQNTNQYFLTKQNDFERDVEYFNDNIRLVFSSDYFQEFLHSHLETYQEALLINPREIILSKSGEKFTMAKVGICPGNTREFNILNVEPPNSSIFIDVHPLIANGYCIRIQNIEVLDELDGKLLRIETDVPSMPEIIIPIIIVD